MAKKRGLGTGLDALLAGAASSKSQQTDAPQESDTPQVRETLKQLPIEYLQPGRYQPRKDMHPEALEELAASIRAQGIMQPIVVRPISSTSADTRYEIIAGERRWRAAQIAELHEVPVIIKDVPDEAAIAMALIENIQRENLNPMEEARALHRLQEEFALTQQQVADAVGKSRVTVTNLLRLMNLNEDVRTLLEHGDIDMGHARALLGLQGENQSEAARQVVSKALTVRQTEALVSKWHEPKKTKKEEPKNPDIDRLESKLGERLGAKVELKHNQKGKGQLVISYSSLDELDGILNHIK
ncbi:ParB/RepB/Spo0J family partition protein [Bermanella marisrubri]|uniref:Probable chromosome-partitioning protein ParB n=1 Tax=Bermanella marisrubri TaxID=207949 RepID=Q1MZ49_9GAMM|nr:ParB/RepB/Spo0J family partition protein [Bermanella marisrubri]EAT11284.1 chromosome partitioning protein Spo0J [Oceanobacter sp. RED65] [Bermanella marisrubri]QIZ82766.1 ParB/RepB/Spo0J family partition protein [Bermanella marisrubri]